MSDCFFSRACFLGLNLLVSSFCAFFPSVVLRIAVWTWMVATLVGTAAGAWAWACNVAANPTARAEKTTRFFFKLETPKCENIPYRGRFRLLKGSADGKPERRFLFEPGNR